MDISVIVPFHNAEDWLEACLGALLKQAYPLGRREYILVDNGSTDGSVAIVRRYPAVRLLSEAKLGAYAARNRGLQEASGEIVAFTDSDCAPRSDWLEQIARIMRDPGVNLVVGQIEFPPGSRTTQLLAEYDAEKTSYIVSADARQQYCGYGGNMAMRKSFSEAVGPFPEMRRGGDTVFVRRAIDRCGRGVLRYAPEVRVIHLEITSSWKWCRKMLVYGRSYQNYRRIATSRSLSNGQRLEIVSRLVAANKFSILDRARLYLMLAVGLLYWYAGCLSGMFTVRDRA
jgi:glycosyltransferase involved in cell wall biosynthesis